MAPSYRSDNAGCYHCSKTLTGRAPVSMGTVGASPPTVFESVGASTHVFCNLSHIPIIFYKNCVKNVMDLVIPWKKEI